MPGYSARIEEGYCDTDRPSGNLRIPGKGRYGNRLIVTNKAGVKVVDHNAAETYRNNGEVMQWLEDGCYRGSFLGESTWWRDFWTPTRIRKRKAWERKRHAAKVQETLTPIERTGATQ